MKVRELLATKGIEIVALGSDKTVHDAIRAMVDRKIGAVLVSMDGKTVGIFTERDVLRCHLTMTGKTFNQISLGEVMTRELIVAELDDDVSAIMSIMIDKSIRHFPVTDSKRIIGMLSIRDIVKSQVTELEAKIHYMKDYVSGIHRGLWI
jgi:IMP dehydrogenase